MNLCLLSSTKSVFFENLLRDPPHKGMQAYSHTHTNIHTYGAAYLLNQVPRPTAGICMPFSRVYVETISQDRQLRKSLIFFPPWVVKCSFGAQALLAEESIYTGAGHNLVFGSCVTKKWRVCSDHHADFARIVMSAPPAESPVEEDLETRLRSGPCCNNLFPL